MQKCKFEEVISLSAVDRMFTEIVGIVLDGQRDSQKQWLSVVCQLRRKKVTVTTKEEETDD